MLEGVPDEGAQVDGTIGHGDEMTADTVGHVELQRNEVEAVDSLPVIKPTEYFPVVPEIENGVEPKLVESKRKWIPKVNVVITMYRQWGCYPLTVQR